MKAGFRQRVTTMSKREIIDQIMRLNRSATAIFLARFSEDQLLAYLHQLKDLQYEHRTDDLLKPMMVAAN
jgi:hypothetical protein